MTERNKKIVTTIIWGIGLVAVIAIMLLINGVDKAAEKKSNNKIVTDVIIYDGSENNPYIEGVQ